jgi:hypothetical protein
MKANKKLLPSIIIVTSILLSGCGGEPKSKDDKSVFNQTESSSLKVFKIDDKLSFEKTETKFDIIELAGLNKRKLIVAITSNEKGEFSQNADAIKDFEVKVNSIDGEKVKWTKKFKGAGLDLEFKAVKVHTPPGANQEDSYSLYSITSGDKIIDYTYSEAKVLIPNTSEKRFITYLSPANSLGIELKGESVIQYADNNELLQSVKLSSLQDSLLPIYTPELRLIREKESTHQVTPDSKSIILMDLDENFKTDAIKGFALQIVVYLEGVEEPENIIIPIVGDRLDAKNAIYNKSIFSLKNN